MFYPRKFEQHGSYPLPNAQRNLCERTHYVDGDSLRFHKSRVLETHITDGGLLFALIESVALNWEGTRRGFRYVVFNIFGDVMSRVQLEDCWPSKEPARKAMWKFLDGVNAHNETTEALARHHAQFTAEMDRLRAELGSEQRSCSTQRRSAQHITHT